MKKTGGYKNYGYGRALHYAGKQALLDYYGEGKYATRAAHAHRWTVFTDYLKTQKIKDTRLIDKQHIEYYAMQLKEKVGVGELTVSYAQNLLSTVNVILHIMRNDNALKISPKAWIGSRTNIRTQVPQSYNTDKNSHYQHVINYLQEHGQHRVAILVQLTRHLGLRFQEASLLNAKQAHKDMHKIGKINITEGTKGGRGRTQDRWISPNSQAKAAIEQLQQYQYTIPPEMNFKQWKNHCYTQWNQANQAIRKQAESRGRATEHAIKGFHDMRAAYACERYQQLTGYPAPVIHPDQQRTAPKTQDQKARHILSQELGHNRSHIMLNYIGSAK